MTTSFSGEVLDLKHPSQADKMQGSEDSFWETCSTFVVTLQSQQIAGEMKHRTISYCLESGSRQILEGLKAHRIIELVGEQPVSKHCQYNDESLYLVDIRQGSQPETIVYQPANSENASRSSENTSRYNDRSIEPAMDDQALVDESNHSLQRIFLMSPQVRSCLNKISSLYAEDGPGYAGGEQPIQPSKEDLAESSLLLLESETSFEEESLRKDDAAEPWKVEITQIQFHLPVEPDQDQVSEFEEESEEAETTDIADHEPEDHEQGRIITVHAATRVLRRELPQTQPLEVEVIFQLKGDGVFELTQRSLPYCTEIYGENRVLHQKRLLGQAPVGYLVNGELTYTCRLTDVSLPIKGTYRLQIITYLENAPVGPDLIELPFVQVS